MLENLSTELDKTESRLDMVSKKVAQVLQLSDGNFNDIYNYDSILGILLNVFWFSLLKFKKNYRYIQGRIQK